LRILNSSTAAINSAQRHACLQLKRMS
jgi:hypothetical protein